MVVSGSEAQPVTGDLQGQNAPSVVSDGGGHAARGTLLDQKDHASTSACTANLCGPATMLCGHRNQLVDEGCGYTGGIAAAELPFFAKQAGDLVPLCMQKGDVHGAGDLSDSLEIAEDAFVPIDVRLEDFPVVDT